MRPTASKNFAIHHPDNAEAPCVAFHPAIALWFARVVQVVEIGTMYIINKSNTREAI